MKRPAVWVGLLGSLLMWLASASHADTIELTPGMEPASLAGHSVSWVEAEGRRTVEQVDAARDIPWAIRKPDQQDRLDGAALWVQFETRAQGDGRWFLEAGSSGIDRAQLFRREPDGRWVVQEAGDSKPVPEWPLPGRVPTFELSHHEEGTVRYLLRVEHARVNFAAPLVIYDQGRLIALREREQFLLGAYFGLAVLITLVATANAVVFRDRSFAAYALYVSIFAIGQVAYLGVGAQHVWPHLLRWNEMSTFLLPGLSSAAAVWFVRTVTEPARYSRVLDLAVWTLIGALLCSVALDTAVNSRITFGLVMALTAAALAVVVGLIALVWIQGEDPTIRVVALGFLPVVIMAIFPVARGLNLIPNSVLTRYGLSIGAILEMPILFYALSLRGARRREGEVRAAALARNDALTGLAHRRTLLQRLEATLVRARSQRHPCALLAARIANFESISREYGREAADKSLVLTASLVRRAIGDVDLASRVGDHDFVLLLEGPTTSAIAMARAQQVVASGLRASDALPHGVTLRFHVAVALLPDKDLDAAGSLQWVLDGAASIPPDARKLIRPLNF